MGHFDTNQVRWYLGKESFRDKLLGLMDRDGRKRNSYGIRLTV